VKSLRLHASVDRAERWGYRIKVDQTTGIVSLYHVDGSHITIFGAMVMTDPEDSDFVWIFGEHHGPFVYARNEVKIKVKGQ